MANNQLQLVTFEQAKKLKEAGFDWDTHKGYDKRGLVINLWVEEFGMKIPHTKAPEVALALKWMRDVKGVHCCINGVIPGCQAVDYEGEYKFNFETIEQVRSTQQYRTYEKAESALLDELLKLIEK